MKVSWDRLKIGLDQLFFTPLVRTESPESRARTVERFLKESGWSWDDVLNEVGREEKQN